jgi:hypothetical protein
MSETFPAPSGRARGGLTPLYAHLLLSGFFVATRLAYDAAGVRFGFALDWMWLSDPADLRDRLAETLYYYHAFPPGMNLLTGILLKLAGASAPVLAHATFWLFGLIIVNALLHLCRAVGLSAWTGVFLAAAFAVVPQTVYFEHLYLYEYPITALLLVAAVLFHAAVRGQRLIAWASFFTACAAVGLTRSTFHLAWFLVLLAASVWLVPSDRRRRVLAAACLPALLLLGLYVKNFALFGVFDAFSFGPVSQSLVTIWNLPPDVRDAWIRDGRLSPFAAVSVYAGPRDYLALMPPRDDRQWPEQLRVLERPTVDAANYNHVLFLEVNGARRADALRYVQERPLDYLATVVRGGVDLFGPSTEWHPLDRAGGSPHEEVRQVLGGYERAFNRAVHALPVAPIGVYVLLPAVLLWALREALRLVRSGDTEVAARGWLLFLCLFQVIFVIAASCLFTFRESSRYRFQVEPMIWVLTALCAASLWHRRKKTRQVV